MIFKSLPDVGAVRAIRHTCHHFKDFFNDPKDEKEIVTNAINRMFSNMPEAFAVWQSKQGQLPEMYFRSNHGPGYDEMLEFLY